MKKRLLSLLLLAALLLTLAAPALADRQITVTFTGDVTLGCEERLRDKDYAFNGFARSEGFDWFFANVKHIFEADDLTVVNLEGVLSDSSSSENTGKTYRFRGRPSYADILKNASIEAVNLANNHTADYGSQGLKATRATLKGNGIGFFGNRYVYVHDFGGIRMGFLGVWQSDYLDNREWFMKKIQALKADGVNSIVFTFHCGTEYARRHGDSQANFASFALQQGCDLVVMHHPHVLQGIDVMGNRNVLWSLGNFCFGGNCEVRELYTAIAQVTFTFADDGTYKGQQLRLYPAHISGTYPNSNFQPKLVTGQDADYVMSLIQDDTNFRLNPYDSELGYAEQDYLPAK